MSLFIVSFLAIVAAVSSKAPCHYHMSVNISHGFTMANGSMRADGVVYSPEQQFVHDEFGEPHLRGCLCMVKTCVRKCCAFNEAYVDGGCTPTNDPMVNPFNPPVYNDTKLLKNVMAYDTFGFVFRNACGSAGGYVMNPYVEKEDEFLLQQDGSILLPVDQTTHSVMHYCIDAWITNPSQGDGDQNWTTKYLAYACFPEDDEDGEQSDDNKLAYSLFPIGMIISIPFLVITFLVYAIIPELRNLHGKSMMCYVAGLISGYTCLSIVQIQGGNPIAIDICISLAFIIYLSFMVSFFWLNVMCFDIWWTFSNMRAPRGSRRTAERRRFIMYSLYAWGAPLMLTAFCALMQFLPDIPKHHVLPHFGEKKCWFHDRSAEMRYFFIPVMIIIVCNAVLFGTTAFKILSIKRETAMLRTGDSGRHSQYEKNKQRFNLYLKLFLVMGINWVAEWVSFMVEGENYLWIITDFCNSIQGIFIFILFICKKKIKNLLIKRYRLLRYGSVVSKARDSSRYRSGNTMSTTEPVTEKSFMSMGDNAIRLSEIK